MSCLCLPPELLPRVLDYAERSTLAVCLLLSHDTFKLASRRLYRDITYDPNSQRSLLLGFDSPTSSKSSLLNYIETFTLYHHDECTHPSTPLHLPKLQILRLILEPWEMSCVLCWTHRLLCPFLTDLRPTTLIVENLYSVTSSLPKGLGSPDSHFPPPFFSSLTRIYLKPNRFELRMDGFYTRMAPFFVDHIPEKVKEVMVIFESMPGETWPRWYQEPNEEWLPVGLGLGQFVNDLADVCEVRWKEGYGHGHGQGLTFVNAGAIDAEFLGMKGVGQVQMRGKVEGALRYELRVRRLRREAEELEIGGLEIGGDESEEGVLRFERMESCLGMGVLDIAVEKAWQKQLRKRTT